MLNKKNGRKYVGITAISSYRLSAIGATDITLFLNKRTQQQQIKNTADRVL